MYKLFITIFIGIGLNNASCMKVNFSSLTNSYITVLFKEKEIQKLKLLLNRIEWFWAPNYFQL